MQFFNSNNYNYLLKKFEIFFIGIYSIFILFKK